MDNTNAVLPIEGRAAIITRSEGCQPEVTSSKALNPEGTPLNPSARLPAISIPLYEKFVSVLSQELHKPVQTGQFGAEMKVELVNDGPVTIIIDSKTKI